MMTTNASARIIAAATFIIASVVSAAFAQPARQIGWVDLNVGTPAASPRILSTSVVSTSSLPDGVWGDVRLKCDYSLANGRVVDIGAGVLIARLVGAGLTIDSMTRTGPVTVSIRETGVFGTGVLEGAVATPASQRVDDSVNLAAVFIMPLHRRVQARMFGGPSYVRMRQDVIRGAAAMPEFDLSPDGRMTNIRLSAIRYRTGQVETNAWGYHVGGTVSVFFTRVLGLGVTIKYLHAVGELPYSLESDYQERIVFHRLSVGGLRVLAGSHLRF